MALLIFLCIGLPGYQGHCVLVSSWLSDILKMYANGNVSIPMEERVKIIPDESSSSLRFDKQLLTLVMETNLLREIVFEVD